ncbi:MAG: hypothetical protein C0624_10490 [Desulfuromonas sp.]|nr:MAG: hypothetical protein C0624_10490 [Desulfuromonas sp.]
MSGGMMGGEQLHEQTQTMDQERERVSLYDADCEKLELRYREREQKLEQQYLEGLEKNREQAEQQYQKQLENLEQERNRERERLRRFYGLDES